MKPYFLVILALLDLLPAVITPKVFAENALPVPTNALPVNIIFDTDMGDDCDDVGALFILHGAVDRGEAKLLATMGCISADAIAPCLDAINTWFGRPEIPVGTLKDFGFIVGPHYTSEIAKRFPHKFAHGKDYPDAAALYRQVLAKQPDGSVVVVAIGPLRNLANLVKSGPDEASPLDGHALVAQKVKKLEIMGGTYPPFANTKEAEWNFKQDPAAASLVCSTWPTPVVFNGEGGSTCSGRRVTYEMPEHNPLTMAYRHYPGVGFAGDRLSWDSITSMVTVHGAAPCYKVVGGGVNVTDAATGINTWKAGEDRGHAYLVLQSRKAEIEKALEDLMVAGKGRPSNLTFNTAYYADAGMCQITSQGAVDATTAASKAFDREDKTAWRDKAASSWIQCQYADGRKYRVTSYAVVCTDKQCLPRTLELSGSNDGGGAWTVLDSRNTPEFTEQTPRREFAIARPAKWNIYRLSVSAANENEGVQVSTIELNEAINCRPKVAVSEVAIDQKALVIPANSRAAINATVSPMGTFERDVAWVSSDPSVAEVRRIGEQIAMVAGKIPGTCTVTAMIENVKQTCAVTVTPSTLPDGWHYDELNTSPIPGSAVVEGGKFTLTGCGHALSSWWERVRDQGVFVSKAVTGDAALSARLTSLAPNVGGPNAYPWDNRPPTASGLMIRESLTEKCGRFLLIQVDAADNLVCRWRNKTGDQDDNQKRDLGKVTLPIHLRLVQSGQTIQVFATANGRNRGEPRMTHPTRFDERSRIGFFVCSGNTFSSTTAVFDDADTNKVVQDTIAFPKDEAVLDLRRDFGAKGDGVADDTEALQKGIEASCGAAGKRSTVLFLPNGIYRVTRTLVVSSAVGPWVYGESRDGVVLRLADGITDTNCTAVIRTHPREKGNTSADWFMRNFRNLTIDVGNNPGVDGIRWYGNNSSILKNIRVTGHGKIGINAGFLDQSGPNLIQDATIEGFETGIRSAWIWGETLSRVAIRNCRSNGVVVSANAVGIEDLTVEDTLVAIRNEVPNNWGHWGGVIALVGGRFSGGSPTEPAIMNQSVLYARDVKTKGFKQALESSTKGANVNGPDIGEYASGSVKHLFDSSTNALRLPIKPEPIFPWENDPAKWVCANDHGAVPGDNKDDTTAIQQAIDAAAAAGKTTVFFRGVGGGDPNWYNVNGEVRVHGSVRHILALGFGRILGNKGAAKFVVSEDSAPLVKFQHLQAFGGGPVTVENRSFSRTLIVESCDLKILGTGTGDIFLTDCPSHVELRQAGQKCWARQLNPEGTSDAGLVQNAGADLWVLGAKFEGAGVRFRTSAGGRTEVLGMFLYDPGNLIETDTRPIFDIDNASFSVAGLREINFGGHTYTSKVREKRGDETRTLDKKNEGGWIGWSLFNARTPPAK